MIIVILSLFWILTSIYYYKFLPKSSSERPFFFSDNKNLIWFSCLILDVSLALALAIFFHWILFFAPFIINIFITRHFFFKEIQELKRNDPELTPNQAYRIVNRNVNHR